MKKLYAVLLVCCFVMAGCVSNKMIKIEDDNNYHWQRYMNEAEFNDLRKGFTYMEVAEIAGGKGLLLEDDNKTKVYVWPDEILMTQVYEITFENNQLVKKEKVEQRGNSERKIEKKKPAVPGS